MVCNGNGNRNRRSGQNQDRQEQGVQQVPQWIVSRSEGGRTVDQESFRHFGDAWAYAQPDPENGIYHYIHRGEVLQHFHEHPTTALTTAYEGNIRITLRCTFRATPQMVSNFST